MTNELHSRGGMRISRATLIAALAIAPDLVAQNSLRGWGGGGFDTEAYALPATWIAAVNVSSAVLRSDGRIYVLGSPHLPNGPPAPAGTSYIQVGISRETAHGMLPCGFGLLSNGSIVSWSLSGAGPSVPALPANTTYVGLSAGYSHAIALRSDGVAVAWGANWSGQTTLPAVAAGVAVQRVHAGYDLSLLLLTNGTIVGCGNNLHGVLSVPALPAGITYTDLWGGMFHSIARRSDGAIVSWGDNTLGQCNVPALPPGVIYTMMGVGGGHTVAARSDGVVAAWGDNSAGQCNVPALPPGIACVQIAAADTPSLVLLANGAVVSWGRGLTAMPPALAPGERWADVASGNPVLCLTSSGRALPLGLDPSTVPPLPSGMTYTDVIGSDVHSVALRSDGRAVAWGSNLFGQCAIPPLPSSTSYTAASACWGRTVLLRSDGEAVSCGSGVGTIPVLPPGIRYEEVSCHDQGMMLRRSDGAVIVLGGTSNNQVTPPGLPPGVQYVSVARARYYCVALRSDGQVATWGTTLAAPLPPLPSGVVYVEIDAGYDQMVARRSDGQVVGAAPTANEPALDVPIAAPGESFVDLSVSSYMCAVRVGPTCTYVSFANGCAGTRPASRLVPRDTPRLGRLHEVTLFDLPQNAAMMVFGWNRIPPLLLAAYGMPGCFQHITPDATVMLLGQNAVAKYWLGIPSSIGLVGLHFHNQAIVFDSTANAAGAVVSNAAEGVIGSW